MHKPNRHQAREEAEALSRKLHHSLGRMDAAADALDSVRLRMRQSVPAGERQDVFEAEITGITEIPDGFPNGHA